MCRCRPRSRRQPSRRRSRASSPAGGAGPRKTARSAAAIVMCCPLPARPGSIPKPGARIARSTSSADPEEAEPRGLHLLEICRQRLGQRALALALPPYLLPALLRELLRQLNPLPVRRELLIRTPVRARLMRRAHLLEGDGEIEVRVGEIRIESQRMAVARQRFREASEVVVDVAEVEVGLEKVGLEADGPLVQRLRLGQLVPAVVDVRQIDERGDQVGIDLERLPVCRRRLVLFRFVAVVEKRRLAKVIVRPARCRARGSAASERTSAGRETRRRSSSTLAGAASRRKSNASCPWPEAISARTMPRNDPP